MYKEPKVYSSYSENNIGQTLYDIVMKLIDKIQLRQYEVAPSTAAIIKFFFKAVTISADQTITIDFD